MSKGPQFERDFAVELSLWWTRGKRQDVFWRTSGSGGRAKRRGRSGKATAGQHGDIAATDPIGAPLIDLITIELKKGYNREGVMSHALDKSLTSKKCLWETWIEQAVESSRHAKTYGWLLVHKRDRREAIVYLPETLYQQLKLVGAFSIERPLPIAFMMIKIGKENVAIRCFKWCQFLRLVKPENVMELAKELK